MAFIGDNSVGAWCNINGTNASVRDSHNISSVSFNGNGDYTYNFSSGTWTSANYVVTFGSGPGHGRRPIVRTNTNNDTTSSGISLSNYSTSACRCLMNGIHGGSHFSVARTGIFNAMFSGPQ